LALLDLDLADTKCPVDGLRPIGEEDRPRVGDESLGRAIMLYRLVKDGEEGIQVLCLRVTELASTALE
jgi:hypothetical protein